MAGTAAKRYGMTVVENHAYRLAHRIFSAINDCDCAHCHAEAMPCEDCPDCQKKIIALITRSLKAKK